MKSLVGGFLVLLIAGSLLPAQEFRSTISGRVVDPGNAVVPNVKIVAVQISTGSKYETVSGNDGQYSIPFLMPGTYQVAFEAPGFKRFVQPEVTIAANERVGVDAKLEVGGITETVVVSDEAPLLQTATASVGQSISQQQLETLPMNGRSPFLLAQLAFGVIYTASPGQVRPFDNSAQSNMSMGGSPSGRAEFLMDGATDSDSAGKVAFSPVLDSVQEVKVEVFQMDAAFGHTGGGTINVVTKSGTNEFHGSLFAFNQTSALAANGFFRNANGQPRAVRRYNQYGGTVGGPLVIPKLVNGKNKLFFYFAYEGVRSSSSGSGILTVPTLAQKAGDFSSLLKLGSNYQIYNPYSGVKTGSRVSRSPYPGNIITPSHINPVARKILDYYPAPNLPGLADGQNNFISSNLGGDNYDSQSGRIDYYLTTKQKLYFNFRRNNRMSPSQDYFQNPSTGRTLNEYNYGGMLDHVYALRPTLVLNSRFNWTRKAERRWMNGEGFDFTQLGFPASLASQSQKMAFPVIIVSPYQQLMNGRRVFAPYETFQIFESVNKVFGAHILKMGVDLRLKRRYTQDYANTSGSYTFAKVGWTNGPFDNSAGAPIGQELASLLLGLPSSGSFDYNASEASQAGYYALFLQDDFRVNRSLTLNLGLRYERDVSTTERFNRTTNGFDFSTQSPISTAAAAAYAKNPIAEVPVSEWKTMGGVLYADANHRTLYNTAAHNFSPRAGFAWKPNILGGRTVIRGGTGVFFYPVGVSGIVQTGFSSSTPIVPTNDGYLTPYSTLSNPFPAGLIPPTGSSLGLSTNLGRGASYVTRDRSNTYSFRWNFSLQRELPGHILLEAGYFGNRGVHVENSAALNYVPAKYLSTSPVRDQKAIDFLTANVANPFAGLMPGTTLNGNSVQRQQLLMAYPHFTSLSRGAVPEGSSIFHAMQARVDKRFSSGLLFVLNYQWSKLLQQSSRLDPSDTFLEKVVPDENRPHNITFGGIWDLPFGSRRKLASNMPHIVNFIISGWNLNALYQWQTGHPLALGNVIYYGGPLNADMRNVSRAFDTTRFNTKSTEQLSYNIRRLPTRFSDFTGDAVNNFDLSVMKKMKLMEKLTLEYRCEFFNAFNHPMFGDPNLSPTSSTFGVISGQANNARQVQMALRLVW